MSEQVDDFLAHVGIRGMKWGKRKSKTSDQADIKSGMSRKKKVAIAVGTGAAVALGAAITLKVMSKNGKRPLSDIMDKPAVKRGQQTPNRIPPKPTPSVGVNKPKPPSPYPMTPLIATPILDEIIKKYNL